MPYNYDVFLSYRRSPELDGWIEAHFLPLLSFYLGQELGEDASIFFDRESVQTGEAWPQKLAAALASSKVMVCLWSRQYFSSEWCSLELRHMRTREETCGLATLRYPGGIIVPLTIHDGDRFPALERITQPLDFKDVFNPRMAQGSRTAEKLAERIGKLAADTESAIRRAPAFDPSWADNASSETLQLFRQPVAQQTVPSLG